jgi:hypothetical protein
MKNIINNVCNCRGSMGGVHVNCILTWIHSEEGQRKTHCPNCRGQYNSNLIRQHNSMESSEAFACVLLCCCLVISYLPFLLCNLHGYSHQFQWIKDDANMTVSNLVFHSRYPKPDCQQNRYCEMDINGLLKQRQWNRPMYSFVLNLTLVEQPGTLIRQIQILYPYKSVYTCCGLVSRGLFLENELYKLERKWNGSIIETGGKRCVHASDIPDERRFKLVQEILDYHQPNYCVETITNWDCVCVI